MFENLTYKQKFLIVIGGFVLLSLASYKKSFKQVLMAKKELNHVETKLELTQGSFDQIYNLKSEIDMLDNIIGGHTSNPEKVQQEILDFVSKDKFKVNLVSIEDVHLFSDSEFLIYTNQMELQGSYHDLMHLLHEIEKNFKVSKVVSTNFYSKKNYRTNTNNLYLRIILQNYEKAN